MKEEEKKTEEKLRYSPEELEEFRQIILEKLEKARAQQRLNSRLAARQERFINNLEAALVRIENGTYGICRETGKLISKARQRKNNINN